MIARLEKQATRGKEVLAEVDALMKELNAPEATELKQLTPSFMYTRMYTTRANVAQCVSAVELAVESKKGDGQKIVKEIVAAIPEAQAAFDSLSSIVSEAKEHLESMAKTTADASKAEADLESTAD